MSDERHAACGTRIVTRDARPMCPRCLVYVDGHKTARLTPEQKRAALVFPPRIEWATSSDSTARMEEMALVAERLAGNVSCYAGGGIVAFELRAIARRIRTEIAPMP